MKIKIFNENTKKNLKIIFEILAKYLRIKHLEVIFDILAFDSGQLTKKFSTNKANKMIRNLLERHLYRN